MEGQFDDAEEEGGGGGGGGGEAERGAQGVEEARPPTPPVREEEEEERWRGGAEEEEEDMEERVYADEAFDRLEAVLMGEDSIGGGGGGAQAAAVGAAGGGGGVSLRKHVVNLGKMSTVSQAATNDIKRSERLTGKSARHTGRDDRATQEAVLDPRTRMLLFKLLNRGVLSRIDGCVSTGKEANVYYARGRTPLGRMASAVGSNTSSPASTTAESTPAGTEVLSKRVRRRRARQAANEAKAAKAAAKAAAAKAAATAKNTDDATRQEDASRQSADSVVPANDAEATDEQEGDDHPAKTVVSVAESATPPAAVTNAAVVDQIEEGGAEAHVVAVEAAAAAAAGETSEQSTADDAERPEEEFAVKIYKTSILVFRDRDKYVSGEHRFRHGYCRSNPRKMVKTWAEKELRNLKRLHAAGIPCPRPVMLKSHVLVMEWMGTEDGWPAPRLKDLQAPAAGSTSSGASGAGGGNGSRGMLSATKWQKCYAQTVCQMRTMLQVCRLVHGDLSEYNMLYHRGQVVFIDVSQSVEQDHPFATEFLRKDCRNVNNFFRRQGVRPMSTRQLFDFVMEPAQWTEEQVTARLEEIQQNLPDDYDGDEDEEKDELGASASEERGESGQEERKPGDEDIADSAEQQKGRRRQRKREDQQEREVEDAVFMQAYLPRSLMELDNVHEEIHRLEQGAREPAYTEAVRNLLGAGEPRIQEERADAENGNAAKTGGMGDIDDDDDDDDDEDDDEDEEWVDWDEPVDPAGRLPANPERREAAKQLKREARRLHKEEAAERRKSKLPKHIKKQRIKRSARHRR